MDKERNKAVEEGMMNRELNKVTKVRVGDREEIEAEAVIVLTVREEADGYNISTINEGRYSLGIIDALLKSVVTVQRELLETVNKKYGLGGVAQLAASVLEELRNTERTDKDE